MPQGRIVNVVERPVGSRLVGDLASGSTVVVVDDVYEFNEVGGGLLQIGAEEYTYTAKDDDAQTLTLDSPTTEDYLDQDLVLVSPTATEKTAVVTLNGGGSTEFKIPFVLWAWVEESTRGTLVGELVSLTWDGQQYVFQDLVAVPKKFDGAAIDPNTTIDPGALTDGKAPSGSPTPSVAPYAIGAVFWTVTPVPNPDPTRFKVYADFVDPPTIDAAHLVDDTASLFGSFDNIGGVRLLPDDPNTPSPEIYVAVVEYDADGDAPVSATSTAVIPRRAGTSEISADWVYAGYIEANQIISGSILTQLLGIGSFIALDGSDSSITIYADADHTQPLIQLRPDGSVFRAQQVSVDDLAVLHSLRIQGTLSVLAQSGVLTLESAIGDPPAAPTLTLSMAQASWPAVPAGWTQRGICWDATGSQWLRLLIGAPFVAGEEKVERITWSGSAWQVASSVTLNVPGTKEDSATGILRLGSSYYMLYLDSSGSVTGWYLSKWSTAGVFQASIRIGPPTDYRPSVGTDGTDILVGRSDVNKVDVYDAALAGLTASWNGTIPDGQSRFVGRGNFDFGANRVLVHVDNTVYVYTLSGSTLTEQVSERFTLLADAASGGLGWNGSAFFSTHGSTSLYEYDSYYPAASEKAYVAYTDTSGADHTKASPVASVTMVARRTISVALPPAPAGAATPKVYMKLATSAPAVTALLIRSETITNRSTRLVPSTAGGSTLGTDSNTFGAGTAAKIQTQSGGYELKGDGTESSPLLGHSDEKILSSDASPTSATNVNMTSLNMSVNVKSTSDVVLVKLCATVLITTTGTLNLVELLIDGVADPKTNDTSLASSTGRYSGYKEWRITGLAPGSHTIAFRTRNSAGSSGATVRATVTSAAYWTST